MPSFIPYFTYIFRIEVAHLPPHIPLQAPRDHVVEREGQAIKGGLQWREQGAGNGMKWWDAGDEQLGCAWGPVCAHCLLQDDLPHTWSAAGLPVLHGLPGLGLCGPGPWPAASPLG